MVTGVAVIHKVPQATHSGAALSAPPEPFSFRLMEWAPQNWYASGLKALQLIGDSVHVIYQEVVVLRAWIIERIKNIYVSIKRGLVGVVVATPSWSGPMPLELRNPTTLLYPSDSFVGVVMAARGIALTGLDIRKIVSHHRGFFSAGIVLDVLQVPVVYLA